MRGGSPAIASKFSTNLQLCDKPVGVLGADVQNQVIVCHVSGGLDCSNGIGTEYFGAAYTGGDGL